jgi:DNA-3-methyladenine glycosylase
MTSGLSQLLVREPEVSAPNLLGAHLVSTVEGVTVRLRITEVEAYKGAEDPASHAFRGMTERNASMFKRPGTLYVYRSYGIHHCANTAAGPEGVGWGILIRGGEIVEGLAHARRRRGRGDHISDGPGKVCEALGINRQHDGHYLLDASPPIWLETGESPGPYMATPRIGISKAREVSWRFVTPVAS